MLILSRRMGESLIIGDDIVVTVLGTKSGQVRIGISAPEEVAVFREEIYARIAAETGHDDCKAATPPKISTKRRRLSLQDSRDKL